jgi:hypothetical protein
VVRAPVVRIRITFRDRDGNRAQATCYCAVSTPQAAVWTLAYILAGRMAALSNALLTQIDLTWRYTIDVPIDPPDDSTNERKILMLITNADDEINGIMISSPRSELWETTGSYAGIRLDLASAGAVGFADMLTTMDLRTDDNRELGTVLSTGGLAL